MVSLTMLLSKHWSRYERSMDDACANFNAVKFQLIISQHLTISYYTIPYHTILYHITTQHSQHTSQHLDNIRINTKKKSSILVL